MAKHKIINKIINNLECELGIDFGIDNICVLSHRIMDGGSYISWPKFVGGNVVYFPSNLRGQELRTFVFHECCHALLKTYHVPTRLLKAFTSRQQRGVFSYLQYAMDGSKFAEGSRRRGFVSSYAAVNNHEDVCETFSAWVSGGYGKKQIITFEDERIDLGKDSRLARKFAAVKKIVAHCRAIEKQSQGNAA